jgi:hypothetical protein
VCFEIVREVLLGVGEGGDWVCEARLREYISFRIGEWDMMSGLGSAELVCGVMGEEGVDEGIV